MQAERILQIIVDWAKKQPTIQAVAVVGSHARGAARADSDIDLVLLATNPRSNGSQPAGCPQACNDPLGSGSRSSNMRRYPQKEGTRASPG
jgi:hypothetical protein